MTITDLCPACLAELPADYPFDHVLIDRALSSQPHLFRTMSHSERTEVVLTGLARGRSLNGLAVGLSWPFAHIQALLPDEHPQSAKSQREALEKRVAELWSQGQSDSTIALRTGKNAAVIGRVRKDLGLASLFGPGGRHLAVSA
jgi:hypothetical protein